MRRERAKREGLCSFALGFGGGRTAIGGASLFGRWNELHGSSGSWRPERSRGGEATAAVACELRGTGEYWGGQLPRYDIIDAS